MDNLEDLKDYPIYEITVTEDDGTFYESFVSYIDGNILKCLKVLDYPEDFEIDFEELPKETQNIGWYLSESQMIEL